MPEPMVRATKQPRRTLRRILLLIQILLQQLPSSSSSSSDSTNNQNMFSAGGISLTTEVQHRVLDTVARLLQGPFHANNGIARFWERGGFPHDLFPTDRELYLKFASSTTFLSTTTTTASTAATAEFKDDGQQLQQQKPLVVYYGKEDGTFLGLFDGFGMHREPGNDGYRVDELLLSETGGSNNSNNINRWHYEACAKSDTGAPEVCALPPASSYIVDDTANNTRCQTDGNNENDGTCTGEGLRYDACAQECPGVATDASSNTSSVPASCGPLHAQCRQYRIATVAAEDENHLGRVPTNLFCQDQYGQPTEEMGRVFGLDANNHLVGGQNCTYADGITPVQRQTSGPFAFCGGGNDNDSSMNATCDDAFTGVFRQIVYDPRYRPWYIQTKAWQTPNWSPVYVFRTSGELGITFSSPFYRYDDDGDDDKGQPIFEGVMATDYRLSDVRSFLVNEYFHTSTLVGIYEDRAPYDLVATSTGASSSEEVLNSDPSKPCPEENSGDSSVCKVVRVPIESLRGNSLLDDRVLAACHERHKAAQFPSGYLALDTDDDIDSKAVFFSQTAVYEIPGANLRWRVLIASPGVRDTSDVIAKSSAFFGGVIFVALLGFAICTTFFVLFYKNRKQKAVIHADWRFTCVFIAGCALLNLTTFTLLGDNTDTTCLLRMWSFPMVFTFSLAPLLVKIWRINTLVGNQGLQKRSISNLHAALYTLPLVLIQTAILAIFTAVDPYHAVEFSEMQNGQLLHHVVCASDSIGFLMTEALFDACLVLGGCYLAYQSRNMNDEFRESKEIAFAMYNIALVLAAMTVSDFVEGISVEIQYSFRAIGVLWLSVLSTAAFALPRLLQVKRQGVNQPRHSIYVTAASLNPAALRTMLDEDILEASATNTTKRSPFNAGIDAEPNDSPVGNDQLYGNRDFDLDLNDVSHEDSQGDKTPATATSQEMDSSDEPA